MEVRYHSMDVPVLVGLSQRCGNCSRIEVFQLDHFSWVMMSSLDRTGHTGSLVDSHALLAVFAHVALILVQSGCVSHVEVLKSSSLKVLQSCHCAAH